jgi:tRNA(fMet)-specific endonuclease VapC
MIYALDSNIISYMLRDNDLVYTKYFEALSNGDFCVIPLMVYYEVLRGLKANKATSKMNSFEKICLELGVDDLTPADMDVAAAIYADRKSRGATIEDSDLLIAAQAVARGYTLVTHNTRHFEDIKRLQTADWAQ